MKIDLKNKNGFTAIDVTIALMIILIFTTIMASYSYNVYLSSAEAKRTAVALNYAVDIFEHIGAESFSQVEPSENLLQIDSLPTLEVTEVTADTVKAKIGTYDISVKIEGYKDGKKIKIITLVINYKVSRKQEETIELQRLKVVNN